MEAASLTTITGIIGSIILAFMYGLASAVLFWRQDRSNSRKTSEAKRMTIFLGLPLVLASISWFGPDAKTLEPILGRLFPFYASIGISFLTYLLPAGISLVIILAKKESPKRWLYACVVFGLAMLIAIWRLATILIYAKGNPHLIW